MEISGQDLVLACRFIYVRGMQVPIHDIVG